MGTDSGNPPISISLLILEDAKGSKDWELIKFSSWSLNSSSLIIDNDNILFEG